MKQFSEETRAKMSEKAKLRCADPEWLKKQHERAAKLPIDIVTSMYRDGHTQLEIANALGVSQKVVWRFMKNHGIKARVAAKRNQFGKNNSTWRGGIVKDEHGYVLVKSDGHPRAKACGGYVREHIFVAEKEIGRLLTENEVVHHINGNKSDNRPENLAVMTKGEHSAYHRQKVKTIIPIAVTKYHFGGESHE